MDATISVIIPIYNTEPYLRRCVESVLQQSWTNLEIILVDDGSTDRCPEICDEYALKDDRVRVIHKKNGGLSEARNAGLDIAEGGYIGFVDSDDWIEQTMYQDLLEAAKEADADVACCGYVRTTGTDNLGGWCPDAQAVVTGEQALRQAMLSTGDNVLVWNKLYRVGMFDDVRFPVGEIHEDNAVFFRLIGQAQRFVYINKREYHYLQRADSIMGGGFKKEEPIIMRKNTERLREYLVARYPVLLSELKLYDADVTGGMILRYLWGGGTTDTTEFRALKRSFSGKLWDYLRHGNIQWTLKLKMLLVYLGLFDGVKAMYGLFRRRFR